MLNDIDPDENFFENSTHTAMSDYFTLDSFNELSKDNTNMATFINYNIRSFQSNSDSFMVCFDLDTMPTAFILTETWHSNEYQGIINGYKAHHTYRVERRSGGISVYVRNDIASTLIPELSFCNDTIEICVVKIRLGSELFSLIGIYRPHSGTIPNFCASLFSVLEHDKLRNTSCLLLGDFNLDICQNSTISQNFIDQMFSFNFYPVITKPTRFAAGQVHGGSLLDHIWTNRLSGYLSGILLLDITDYLPTFYKIHVPSSSHNNGNLIKNTFRCVTESSRQHFSDTLNNFDWEVLKGADLDEEVDIFTSTLNSFYCNSFQLKTKFVSSKKFNNPWMNKKPSNLLKGKSKYYQLFRAGFVSSSENNIFRNKVKSLVKSRKKMYYKHILSTSKSDLRKTWQIIGALAETSNNTNPINELSWNGEILENPSDIAIAFDDFFFF